jgi:hypothetical protein
VSAGSGGGTGASTSSHGTGAAGAGGGAGAQGGGGSGGHAGGTGAGAGGGAGGADAGGPEVLAKLDDEPVALAVVGGDVYVALFMDGIVSIPTAGGAVTPRVASIGGYTPGVYFQNPFTFDAHDLYFAESSGGDTTGPVARAPIGGGAATVLASSKGFTAGIAADATYVYWVDQDAGTVNRVPIAGGAATQLAGGLSTPAGLALRSGKLYFGDAAGDLLSVPAAGGNVTKLFTGPGLPPNTEYADYSPPLVADADNVYFSVCPGGGTGVSTLYRLPIVQGGPPVALAAACASGIAVDGESVYWSDGAAIHAVPVAGGPAHEVATSSQSISAGPAVDQANVYWGITPQVGSCGLCPPPPPGQINAVMRAPK